ncbi:hypothetical protein BC830DRAFT_1079901 [Chytriomyces sp. MP71]|nr:hypothetical protein BC830DRAFT_1079901 [Chytriomyces sp. MP71]
MRFRQNRPPLPPPNTSSKFLVSCLNLVSDRLLTLINNTSKIDYNSIALIGASPLVRTRVPVCCSAWGRVRGVVFEELDGPVAVAKEHYEGLVELLKAWISSSAGVRGASNSMK